MTQNKKGLSGISTLIIFIAIILVAAVAALVLLQTVSSLQSQALQTGKESRTQVSSQLTVEDVIADVNVDNNTTVERLRLTATLAPGSDKINLTQTLISVKTNNFYNAGLDYNQSVDTNTLDAYGADTEFELLRATDVNNIFSVRWLTTAPSVRTAVSGGDQIEIWINVTENLGLNEEVTVTIAPTQGSSTSVYFKTPVSFDREYTQLFP